MALPVFLDEVLGWSFWQTGGFMAAWVIGYGIVQTAAPKLLGSDGTNLAVDVASARTWALALLCVSAAIAVFATIDIAANIAILVGLIVFGIVFALNSSLHSFLILAYSQGDEVSTDVGFYYSANATGRLIGTLLSGLLYLWGGIELALWGSTVFVLATWLLSQRLPESLDTSAAVTTPAS